MKKVFDKNIKKYLKNIGAKQYIGLNISDQYFSLVILTLENKKEVLKFSASEELSKGLVVNGRVKNKAKLSVFLDNFFKKYQIKISEGDKIAFAIPNEQVYVYNFWLKENDEKALYLRALKNEVLSAVPIEESDLLFAFQELKNKDNKNLILSVATKRSSFLEWQEFFAQNNLKISLYNIEPLASFYALNKTFPLQKTAFLDISENSFTFSVFDYDGLLFSLSSKFEKTPSSLDDRENDFWQKVKSDILYVEKNIDESNCLAILIYGDFKNLSFLQKFLEKNLKINIKIIEVEDKRIKPNLINAYGLALRLLNNKWKKSDIFLSMMGEEKSFWRFDKDLILKHKKEIITVFVFLCFVVLFFVFWSSKNKNNHQKEKVLPQKASQEILQKTSEAENKTNTKQENKETEEEKKEEKKIKVKKIKFPLNVRVDSSTQSLVISQVKADEEYPVLEEKENWVKINLGDKQGWVYKKFVSFK